MSEARSLSVEQAQAAILSETVAVRETEKLALGDALDRVLAADVVSPIDVPPCDNAAMDGWALRGGDLAAPAGLREVGCAFAGRAYEGRVASGECVRIMTGAPMPSGADSVVMQESAHYVEGVEGADGLVAIAPGQRPGQHVRRAGEDLRRGAVALAAGTRMNAATLGLAASLGLGEISVFRRLRVAVLSTGDELRSPGEALAPGDIYDSNRHTLLALLQRLGCETQDLGVVADDPRLLEAALCQAASSSDALITSGGVSAGDHDFTRELLSRLGEVRFWNIAMRPGRPMAFGRLRHGPHGGHGHSGCLMFALPGNPVATAVTYLQFARPALLRMMGCVPAAPLLLRARARHAIAKKPGRAEYQRGIIHRDDQGSSVSLTGQQGSAMLSSLCHADCLVVLGHEQGDIAAGDWVDVQLLHGLL